MENLFAYGTLMCEDIMTEVTRCHFSYVSGTIRNYSRRSVKNAHYPAIISHEGSHVEGLIYMNVSDSAWKRLDIFEGEMYARHLVEVELNDGTTLPALTYVVQTDYSDLLEPSEWDFKSFLRNSKAIFQKHYKGYQSL